VLRAAGEIETTQEDIQDWLQLNEGDPEFQLMTEEDFFIYFHQHCLDKFPLIHFPSFCFLGAFLLH
jgi:hypothetical protein